MLQMIVIPSLTVHWKETLTFNGATDPTGGDSTANVELTIIANIGSMGL